MQEPIEEDAVGPAADPGFVRQWGSCESESAGGQAGLVARNGSRSGLSAYRVGLRLRPTPGRRPWV